MKKIYAKLAAACISFMIAVVMILTVSYAWLTMSASPEVNGIQVMIGGGKTIMLAPDLTEIIYNDDGTQTIVHYPGQFESKLVFSQYDEYSYLSSSSGLSPVSTFNGVDWVYPEYDPDNGELKDTSHFRVEKMPDNDGAANAEDFVCIDFWIVSPGFEYTVRTSTDKKTHVGSYLIELPEVIDSEETISGYTLQGGTGETASIARIGFLVNGDKGNSADMEAYVNSEWYDNRYKRLKGTYQSTDEQKYKFTIYEPNGTMHPLEQSETDRYLVTFPLSYEDGEIQAKDICGKVAVQQTNTWNDLLEQEFQAATIGCQAKSTEEAKKYFYNTYLQQQFSHLVRTGLFYENSYSLNSSSAIDNIENEPIGGATNDVYITRLERNVPQRVRMYIWIEGQDPDCTTTESVASTELAIGLELSGAT